jgi:hypothetical protein
VISGRGLGPMGQKGPFTVYALLLALGFVNYMLSFGVVGFLNN